MNPKDYGAKTELVRDNLLSIFWLNKTNVMIFFIIILCSIPYSLNLLGVDFSSKVVPLTNDSIVNGKVITEQLFQAVSGALHHALLEWSAVVLAALATFVSFLHYRINKDITIPIIGLALFSAGVVDAFHTLAATRIISASAPNTDFIPFTWALSRVFNSFIMLLVAGFSLWFSAKHHKNVNQNTRAKLFFSAVILFGGISAIVVFMAASSQSLPQTMFPNAIVTRPYDVLPLALFFCCGIFYWLWYIQRPSIIRFALFLSIFPEAATQLHMAFGSTSLFDNHFNIAHFLKNVAYGSILVGLLIDIINNRKYTENELEEVTATAYQSSNQSDLSNKLKLNPVRWSLGFKVPLAGFVLSLTIALVVGITFYKESYQLVIDKEVTELKLESQIIDTLFTSYYFQGVNDLKFLSGVPPIKKIREAEQLNDKESFELWRSRLQVILFELFKTKVSYKNIGYFLNDTSPPIIAFERTSQGVKDVNLDSLTHRFDDVTNINSSTDLIRTSLNESLLSIVFPVIDDTENKALAYIEVTLDLRLYLQNLQKSALKNINLFLARNDGEIIYFPKDGVAKEKTSFIQKQYPSLIDVMRTYDDGYKTVNSAFSKLENSSITIYSQSNFSWGKDILPLHLFVESRSENFLLAVNNMRYRAILLGFSLAILSLGLSVFAARKLIQPLSDMTKALKNYEKTGNINALPVSEKDEIGLLARAFHNLLFTVEQQFEQQQIATVDAIDANARLTSIVNFIPDAVINIDAKGFIISFNKAAERIFDYQAQEVLQQNISMLMPLTQGNEHDSFIKQYIQTGKSHIIGVGRELTAVRKDGEVFPMHLSISRVETPQGVVFTGLIRDLTASKLLEAEKERGDLATQELAWRLNFALSAPNIGVWEYQIKTQQLSWDERTFALYGRHDNENDLPDDIWQQSLSDKQQDIYQAKMAMIIATGEDLHHQYDISWPDGSKHYLELHARLIEDQNGNNSRIVGTHQDITEQKKLATLKQTALDLAEDSLRLKSEFLASMSHEIRTPMNGVLGMLGLLEQSSLNKQQQHYTELASSSAQSLLTLINDILDFSKIEAGKLDLEVLDFDIRNQLGQFAESMAFRTQDKGLELILDLSKINYSMVKGDPSRIRQILSNLVGNAIKFTDNGEIIIKASVIEFGERLKFLCEVSDTGIGIPQGKIKDLFDSFTQVDATTTRKYGGTGLGLSIAKQLSQLMGGNINVISEVGKGSCFSFSIELEKSNLSQIVMPKVDIKGTQILIVDDNETNLTVLKAQLEIWGAIVTQANDGFEALNQIEKNESNKFAVAILDMQMPGMDGATLGRSLVVHKKCSNLKLIMMTSMSERGDAAFFAKIGFSAYFPKPATTSDLFDALSVVLDDSEALEMATPLVTRHNLPKNKYDKDGSFIKKELPNKTRILLVEDNRINQAVILGILSNSGLKADVAGNGVEALNLLNNSLDDVPYEIIIMDCQMPELDGYDTTKAIRNGEGKAIHVDIPIIAMTANAMKGDKEKCLAAGMNDYATKPVDSVVLLEKLNHWLNNKNHEDEESTNNKTVDSAIEKREEKPDLVEASPDNLPIETVVWQKQEFLQRIRHNEKIATKLISLFLEDSPALISKIITAIEQKQHQEVLDCSHKLKGSTKNLGGQKLAYAIEKIESLICADQEHEIGKCKDDMVREFELLCHELKSFELVV